MTNVHSQGEPDPAFLSFTLRTSRETIWRRRLDTTRINLNFRA